MKHLRRGILLLLTSLALAGCARLPWAAALAPTATPAPSATAAPTLTPVPPTAAPPTSTPAPSLTPAPTATAAPPTATFEPLPPTPTLAPVSAEQRGEIFERVWSIVRDTYLYEDFRGVDWEAARAEFEPRVAAAETPEAFYALMRELIDRLGDEHSRFESPQEVADQEAEFNGEARYGGIGAQIRDVPEGGLVTTLVAGGPAERAGILRRDIIVAVNGIFFTDSAAFGPDGPIGMVRGPVGTTVQLTVRTGDQAPREVTVLREPINIEAFNEVIAQRLAGSDVGLVEIPTFYVDALDERVRAAIEGLLADGPLDGLVIDVRSNAGGYVHLMRNTVALFHDGGSIGSTSGRDIDEEQEIPAGNTIGGVDGVPIVVLVGPDTASAAEMFAAGMRVLGRARVVGTPSAGNTENLYNYNFDDGSRLLIATVAYRQPDGTLIEGSGVVPDLTVDVEWWRYPPDQDPQVIAALGELDALHAASVTQ